MSEQEEDEPAVLGATHQPPACLFQVILELCHHVRRLASPADVFPPIRQPESLLRCHLAHHYPGRTTNNHLAPAYPDFSGAFSQDLGISSVVGFSPGFPFAARLSNNDC